LTNLENAFPEKSSSEIQGIARRFYRHLFDQSIESFKLIHLSRKQILRRFNYKNPEMLDELYRSNKSVIALAGHFTTWEWIVSLSLVTKHKVLAVYKPPSFENFSRIYYYISRRFGINPVPMQEIFRRILDCKSRNELTITFILGDQRPQPDHARHWINFLNQDTPVITGFEKISKKTDQAVVLIDIQWKKRGYYDVYFRKLCDSPLGIDDYHLTEDYFKALEKMIRDRPEFWLWTHRRWAYRKQDFIQDLE